MPTRFRAVLGYLQAHRPRNHNLIINPAGDNRERFINGPRAKLQERGGVCGGLRDEAPAFAGNASSASRPTDVSALPGSTALGILRELPELRSGEIVEDTLDVSLIFLYSKRRSPGSGFPGSKPMRFTSTHPKAELPKARGSSGPRGGHAAGGGDFSTGGPVIG